MPSKRHFSKISILWACFKSLKICEINALFARSISLNCAQSGFTPVLQNFSKPWKSFHNLVNFLHSIILMFLLFIRPVSYNKCYLFNAMLFCWVLFLPPVLPNILGFFSVVFGFKIVEILYFNEIYIVNGHDSVNGL